MNLVLLETSSNQNFIFATNKLRENVGASDLIARSCTYWLVDAVLDAGGPDLRAESAEEMRRILNDATKNRPIDELNPVEVILAVSGKALLLVRDRDLGSRIVTQVTRRAVKETPGMDLRGVVSNEFDLSRSLIHDVVKSVHREYEFVRSRLPGAATRFQRLPIVTECSTSGLPAKRFAGASDELPKNEEGPRSAQSLAKIAAREGWRARLNDLLNAYGVQASLPNSTTHLQSLDCDWFAIVHADGNGLGKEFLHFDKRVKEDPNNLLRWNRAYIDQLRQFSFALDDCTQKAFCDALRVFRPSKSGVLPIVPLVLGGDDLTVVCDGRQALQFTKTFIENFEQQTSHRNEVTRIVPGGVTSCAGVAILKPHFPFFAGYQLAEELLQSAKSEKPRSAIDFHILYDASGPDLDRIRGELTLDGQVNLVARPYLVRPDVNRPRRSWNRLPAMVEAIRCKDDDGRRQLPNSMLHDLREGLFLGIEAAEARLRLVRERYKPHIDPLLEDNCLFWNDGTDHRTSLLDALDVAAFWEGQE